MAISKLMPLGVVKVDTERLAQLYTQLGTPSADSVVHRAMEELAVRLAKVDGFYKKGSLAEMQRAARSMVAISEQIGMTTFAISAANVHELALTDDSVALAAAMDRLMRTGENSLLAVWVLQGASL